MVIIGTSFHNTVQCVVICAGKNLLCFVLESILAKKPLRKLFRLSPEQWMKLSQKQQLELYNVCVDNLNSLRETLDELGNQLRARWQE